MPGFDPNFFRTQGYKIFFLMQSAQQSPQRQSDQSQSPGTISHVETQLALIEMSSTADVQRLHFVLVVTDKDKRRVAV